MKNQAIKPILPAQAQETEVSWTRATGQQGKTPVSHAGSARSVTGVAHQFTPLETAKFWTRVRGRADYECWEWQGTKNVRGYGRCHGTQAHRIAYSLIKGPIPEGMIIRHRCDNPSCCNPAHLLVGTASDNAQDALERGQFATGTRHGNSKLKPKDIEFIRNHAHIASGYELAKMFKVARSTISYVLNGKTWVR